MRPTYPGTRTLTSLRSARRLAKAMTIAMAATAALSATPARASDLALDVTGRITTTTDPAQTVYHFTEAQLLKLPPHSITTSTAWTSKSVFTGPSLSDILKIVGAQGEAIELRTLDDYTITIPLADADRYGVILAYSMNGKRLQISDFGPLFLIYPRDAHRDELSSAVATARFVWQIKSLVVK